MGRCAAVMLVCLMVLFATAAGGMGREGGEEGGRFEFTRLAMGDAARIVVYAKDEPAARAAAAAAFDRIAELEAVMTDYRDDSELMRLCAVPAGTEVRVSEDLFGVLSHASRLARATDGAYDPTVGPVVALWRQARTAGSLPDPAAIEEAIARTGHDKMVLNDRARTVTLTAPGMRLDLGGIGKGYAADAAAAILDARGLPSYLVAMGGDIVVGEAPPGEPGWRVALPEPEGAEAVLVRTAVSTSGDTHQVLELGGERYSHIVDPKTGLGLRHQATVTVAAPDSTTADAMATAISVSGGEGGVEMLRNVPGVGVRMVKRTEAGVKVWATAKFPPLDGRAHTAREAAAADDLPPGFRPLFNGHDLAGWEPVVADPPQLAKMTLAERTAAAEAARAEMAKHWHIQGDVLHMDGGWTSLATTEQYGDFELRLEWKIAAGGDSGVYLRDCPQVQIWDNPAGSGGLYNNERGGATPRRVADRPVGEWNAFRIVMAKGQVTVHLNGELVADRVALENYWDRAAPPPAQGRIWLQAHGTPLWFRNIAIRRLGE